MTDYTKLIEEACSTAAKYELENYYGTSKGYTAMCKVEAEEAQRALQSAIEALQEKNALLEGTLESRERNITELQAENERLTKLHIEVVNEWRRSDKERASVQAKLDALQTQEPVGRFVSDDDCGHIDLVPHQGQPMADGQPVYAAPKAPTPEQVEEAWRAGWAACRDAEYVGQEAEDDAWGMSQTCANADWESAAPKALEPLTNGDHIHPNAEGRARVMEAIEAAHGIKKGTP